MLNRERRNRKRPEWVAALVCCSGGGLAREGGFSGSG